MSELKQYIKFKEGVDIHDLELTAPMLLVIIGEAAHFYHCCKKEFVITSLNDGKHKSDTHYEGRGCDIRVWGVTEFERERLCHMLNKKYAMEYGTGPEGAIPKVAINEKDHIHLQVRRGL